MKKKKERYCYDVGYSPIKYQIESNHQVCIKFSSQKPILYENSLQLAALLSVFLLKCIVLSQQNVFQSYQFQFNFFWKYFEIWSSVYQRGREKLKLRFAINYLSTILFYKHIPEVGFPPQKAMPLSASYNQAATKIQEDQLLIKMIWQY